VKIEWLYEAQMEYKELLSYYKNTVGLQAARKFSQEILGSISGLEQFTEMGLLKEERLLGRYGFRALFIGKYVCIYRVDEDAVRRELRNAIRIFDENGCKWDITLKDLETTSGDSGAIIRWTAIVREELERHYGR